jgi:two-component system LytT family response regulator
MHKSSDNLIVLLNDAIKAIRFNALDYLMKPVEVTELKAAISRYRENLHTESNPAKVQQALKNLDTPQVAEQVFTLKSQDGEIRIILKDIVRLEADRNYSTLYLTDGRKKVTAKTLRDMGELLEDKGFFRCHKSHLVNIVHIKDPPNSFYVKLSDGSEVPIARRKKDDFLRWYEEASA